MFLPKGFREDDREKLLAIMQSRGFGMLVAHPEIAHLPFLVDDMRLRGHVAKANPIARMLDGRDATVVFSAGDAYVSPTWYVSPNEHVPTWNYAVVHAVGRLREATREELRASLVDLARRYEGDAWSLDQLAPDFVESLLDAIVGFTFEITKLEGKLKLSQNRSSDDHARVMAALRARGDDADRALLDLMAPLAKAR